MQSIWLVQKFIPKFQLNFPTSSSTPQVQLWKKNFLLFITLSRFALDNARTTIDKIKKTIDIVFECPLFCNYWDALLFFFIFIFFKFAFAWSKNILIVNFYFFALVLVSTSSTFYHVSSNSNRNAQHTPHNPDQPGEPGGLSGQPCAAQTTVANHNYQVHHYWR